MGESSLFSRVLIVLIICNEFVLISFVVVDDSRDGHTFNHFLVRMIRNAAGREIPCLGFPGTLENNGQLAAEKNLK